MFTASASGVITNLQGGTGGFIIGTTTNPYAVQLISGVASSTSAQASSLPCSITDVSGCFSNALSYLFYPDQNTFTQFETLNTTISTKSPFVYVYQMQALRNEMFNATPTGTTTLSVNVIGFGTITFLSKSMIDSIPFEGVIYNLLIALLYFGCAEFLYYNVIKMHD